MNKKCFIAMPFVTNLNGVWNYVIKPTIEDLGDTCIRGDDFFTVGYVLNNIFSIIHSSDYIIAEVSAPNPNVYYELGYAHAIEKKTVLITQNISTLPFDLRGNNCIIYNDSAEGAFKLKSNLIHYINNL